MDEKLMFSPFWKDCTVHSESVIFFEKDASGQVDAAPLFYEAKEILSVTSSDYEIQYKEGRDYELQDGKLVRTRNSRMPLLGYDEYHPKQPAVFAIASLSAPGRYVGYAEGGYYHKKQLLVSYRHEDEMCDFAIPGIRAKLPLSTKRLEAGEEMCIVLYGDSIMEGCDSSAHCKISPYHLPFSDLLLQWLAFRYPKCELTSHNTAVGGTNSTWGLEQARERVAGHLPDLVLINFGMNDTGAELAPETYRDNIYGIIKCVREQKREAEFILLTPGVANPDCVGWTKWQRAYRPMLEEISSSTAGVAVVPLGETLDLILSRKRYEDVMGNAVNHPNDFMSRVYAQSLIEALSA